MQVLVACECSGVVRRAFQARGHEAYSCDLLPAEDGETKFHIQDDVRKAIWWARQGDHSYWDLMIAHPPCDYLSVSGLHWNKKRPERSQMTEDALEFVRLLLDAPIPKIALENPVGAISTRIRKPDQYIQPYEFGHDASKRTGLWLKGLPRLVRTGYVEPRLVSGRKRWANQTDSGQNILGPSPTRKADRARTYQGVAEAMARQWG